MAPLEFVFRFDAGPQAGAGHFMRQLALAQEASSRGRVTMLMPETAHNLAREIGDEVTSETLPKLGTEAEVRWLSNRFGSGSIFFVDSYELPLEYYDRLARIAFVVAFEDGERELASQLVVKPRPRESNANAGEMVLEGCEFIPVRRGFRSGDSRKQPRETGGKRRLLICFGASDVTASMPKLLSRLPVAAAANWVLAIVVGPLSADVASDALPLSELSARGWEVELHNSPNMASLMANVDAAVVACGSVVWELASLAVPTLAYAVVENQERNATLLRERACIATLEDLPVFLEDRELLASLSTRLHALVDGRGAERVVDAAIARVL